MAVEKVTAKVGGKDGKPTKGPYTVDYDFGEPSLKGLVTKFGEEVVFSRAKSALVIDLQALMRREIEGKEFTEAKLKQKVGEWKPSVVSGIRRSASERLEDSVAKMTPEQQKELLAKLTAQVAGQKGNSGGAKAAQK